VAKRVVYKIMRKIEFTKILSGDDDEIETLLKKERKLLKKIPIEKLIGGALFYEIESDSSELLKIGELKLDL